MFNDLRNNWLTGVTTIAAVAIATYVAFGFPSEKSNEKKLKRLRAKNKLSGLVNEGNTCFLNSTLQALASCPSIVRWIQHLLPDENLSLGSLGPIFNLHTVLFVVNNQHPTIKVDLFNTRQLVQSIQRRGWNFKSEEQDAHEFFNILLTAVDEEINYGKNSEAGLSLCIQNDSSTVFNPSPFRGYLTSQLSCLNCNQKVPVRYDAFECLSIPLPKVDLSRAFSALTVEDLLRQFLAAETVNEVRCDACHQEKSIFKKQLSLGKLPSCLCLHIQRSHWTNAGQLIKRQDMVKFDCQLNVSNYTYNNRLAAHWKPKMYNLRAVIVHMGAVDSGHFVTYRQHLDSTNVKWFFTSDSFVRAASLEEVLGSCPYMLFYEKSL